MLSVTRKSAGFRQDFQLRLVKMVDVTQPASATAPVKQVITGVHVAIGETDLLPGLHAAFEFIAVQELPFRMDELAAGSQQGVDLLQDGEAQIRHRACDGARQRRSPGRMDGRTVRSDGLFPVGSGQVGADEGGGGILPAVAGGFEQRLAEVQACIRNRACRGACVRVPVRRCRSPGRGWIRPRSECPEHAEHPAAGAGAWTKIPVRRSGRIVYSMSAVVTQSRRSWTDYICVYPWLRN